MKSNNKPRRPFLARAHAFHIPRIEERAAKKRASSRGYRSVDDEILSILRSAQEGDFNVLARLLPIMKNYDDDLLWGEASFLLSYAAPSSVLREVLHGFSKQLFVDKDYVVQSWIAETLLNSGLLWAIPEALRILKAQEDRSKMFSIPARLSFLIEVEPGEVFFGPDEVPEPGPWPDWFDPPFTYNDSDYIEMVTAHFNRLVSNARYGADTAFLLGNEINVAEMSYYTLQTIGKSGDTEDIALIRTVLEAQTGYDLSGFYSNLILDRNGAIGAIENLFDDVDLSKFSAGKRYFFGKLISD